jgi:hypothetical protein
MDSPSLLKGKEVFCVQKAIHGLNQGQLDARTVQLLPAGVEVLGGEFIDSTRV